jgi:hypothetical protein
VTRSNRSPRRVSSGHDFCRVPEQTDRQGTPFTCRCAHTRKSIIEGLRCLVQVARLESALDPRRIDLDAQDRRTGKRRRQRLRAAHPAEPGGEDRAPGEVGRAEVLLGSRHERLVGALQDPLAADVDPAAGRHLAEHRQAKRLEPPKLVPRRPARDEQRVRDQHAWRRRSRAEDTDRLPALDEQCLVLAEREQRPHERPQRLRVSRRFPGAAVDDELLRPLGDLGIEVVQQHP